MFKNLKQDFTEALTTILPIVLIVLVLSLFIPMDTTLLTSFLFSSILLIIGSTLFTFGANISMILIGNKIGKSLVQSKKLWLILIVSFIIGTIVTIAEPDLIVLAEQVTSISSEVLILVISVGVGLCLVLAALRSLFGLNLNIILILSFIAIFVLSFFVPEDFIPVAFDSGGVTTGTMSIPFIMTLGIGLVANRTDAKAKEDSFGLVALASTGPILMVMLLGILYKPGSTMDTTNLLYHSYSFDNYLIQITACLKDVLFAILPLVVVFIVYQLITRNTNKIEMHKIILGMLLTIIGLTIFLVASNVGFLNMGYFLGEYITLTDYAYMLVPVIMLVAFFIAIAEPAVVILIEQVSEFTEGSISKNVLKVALALGVSLAAGLSIIRVFTHTSFMLYAVIGYGIALLLTFFIPKVFTAIAFDAGGATGGALTTTFLLPMAVGACYASGGNVFTEAFGLASFVSLVPIITIQVVGILYQVRTRIISRVEQLDDSIIDFDWRGKNAN